MKARNTIDRITSFLLEDGRSLFYGLVGTISISSTVLTGEVSAITKSESILGSIVTQYTVYINLYPFSEQKSQICSSHYF